MLCQYFSTYDWMAVLLVDIGTQYNKEMSSSLPPTLPALSVVLGLPFYRLFEALMDPGMMGLAVEDPALMMIPRATCLCRLLECPSEL